MGDQEILNAIKSLQEVISITSDALNIGCEPDFQDAIEDECECLEAKECPIKDNTEENDLYSFFMDETDPEILSLVNHLSQIDYPENLEQE